MAEAEAEQEHECNLELLPNTKAWLRHAVTSTHIPLAKAHSMDKPNLIG